MQKRILLISLLILSWSINAAHEFPEINNQWLRAAPPGAMMLAAYGELNNNTTEDKVLVGAYSPDFNIAEIHKTIIKDGMAKMVHQPDLTLEPGKQLLFKPGGLHIMLMQPNKQFVEGDEVKICLIYKDGDETSVQHIMFPVVKK
jgi:copper(I)-binding protein